MIEQNTAEKSAMDPIAIGSDGPGKILIYRPTIARLLISPIPIAAKAMGMPGILETVFLGATNGALAACARTSKAWSAPALDCLWRGMDSIIPLFLVLSPLTQVYLDSIYVYVSVQLSGCGTFLMISIAYTVGLREKYCRRRRRTRQV